MIRLYERKTEKTFGNNSIYISFDYKPTIVEYIKNLPNRAYNAETKEWEVPMASLERILNDLYDYDIELNLIDDSSIESVKYDYEFKTDPKEYQYDAINYGLSRNKFLNGDVMGLGKTKESLDVICIRKSLGQIKRCLIICGVNDNKWNWFQEISKHTREKAWVLGMRKNRKGKYKIGSNADKLEDLSKITDDYLFLVTNVETLRNPRITEKLEQMTKNKEIDAIIFDEFHKCKNPTAKQTKALLKLKAKYQIALSGTFMLNSPLDLFVPLSWIDYYRGTQWSFNLTFSQNDYFGSVSYRNLDMLRGMLSDCMIRRTKDVLSLPPKTYVQEVVEMSKEQEEIYTSVLDEIIENLPLIKLHPDPLSQLIRLRQATGYTGILNDKIKVSAKLDRLEDLVEEITSNGYKVLVFSNWTSITNQVKDRLQKYNPAYITGETKSEEVMLQQNKLENDDTCKCMIGTIGKLGTGFTLTKANYVIFLDSPWNMGLKEQACDRVHRIGQDKNVTIITLVTKDTIDERIEELIEGKGQMADMLLDGQIKDKGKVVDFLIS